MTQLRAEILVGQRYRFLNRTSTDQFTETWKAFDTRLGRPVALQLLSEQERANRRAQAKLRAAVRGRTFAADHEDPSAPRVLDVGEDPLYGPFVVGELGAAEVARPPLKSAEVARPPLESAKVTPPVLAVGSSETTERLPTLEPAEPTRPPAGFRLSPDHSRLGLMALVGAILVVLAAFVFAALVFGPADQSNGAAAVSVTPQPPNRPLSGAPAPPRPTVTPELVAPQPAQAPQQPTSGPTSPPANQPTAQPTQQASAQLVAPAAARSPLLQGSPVDTIRQHYAFIDAKRYAEGYALMDAHLRSLNSAADYQSWFVDKISVKPISVDLASQTDSEAVVHSVVDTTDRVDGQSVTKRVSEEFVLHAENGAWRIDQVSQL